MLLKRLELVGFKSFASKTTLDFPGGIVAIVGPNGSGKSNVIDAVRWLLGEREAKQMRGGKSEDLIFAGTPQRARVGQAQARIVFDNSTKFFPVDFTEVEVVRKVSRDGTSQYFLNGAEVRLKDIIHFFAQSKLGTRGLTIINQGSADMFVRASAAERREMIEEILGLRQFQIKKHEAERKLETTRVNLDKVRAMIEELLPRLRLLRRQASRFAERSNFETELRELENQYFGFKLANLGENKDNRERIAELDGAITKAKRELSHREEELRMVEVSGKAPVASPDVALQKQKLLDSKSELLRELGKIEAQLEFAKQTTREGGNADEALRVLGAMRSEITELLSITDVPLLHQKLQRLAEAVENVFGGKKSKGGGEKEFSAGREAILGQITELDKELRRLQDEEAKVAENVRGFNDRFREVFSRVEEKKEEIVGLENEKSKLLFEIERFSIRYQELESRAKEAGRSLSEFKPLPGTLSDIDAIEKRMYKLRGELSAIGDMDPALIKEAAETEERNTFLARELADLEKAAGDLAVLIADLDEKLHTEFTSALKTISEKFNHYFRLMFGGGHAHLRLIKRELPPVIDGEEAPAEIASGDEDTEHEVDHGGIDIDVGIPRKKISGLDVLSGGERTLVSIAVLFALISVSTPPFLVLDEADAALDEANTRRFASLIKEFSHKTQFILVTHNRTTMEAASILYGVTMGEDGTSRVLSLKVE